MFVRPQREQREWQRAPEDVTVDALVHGDRGERVGEAGVEVGVLEHVQEAEDAPAAYDPVLECPQAGRLIRLLRLGHGDPRLALAAGDLHPARRAVRERGRPPVRTIGHALLQVRVDFFRYRDPSC